MANKIKRLITQYICTCAGGETITFYAYPGLKEIKENNIISIQPERAIYEMYIETFVSVARKVDK